MTSNLEVLQEQRFFFRNKGDLSMHKDCGKYKGVGQGIVA